MTKKIFCSALCLLAVLAAGLPRASAAEKVDANPKPQLSKPDGKPADMSKPVQVFILMGQSNMVGLGKIAGQDGSLDNEFNPGASLVAGEVSGFVQDSWPQTAPTAWPSRHRRAKK